MCASDKLPGDAEVAQRLSFNVPYHHRNFAHAPSCARLCALTFMCILSFEWSQQTYEVAPGKQNRKQTRFLSSQATAGVTSVVQDRHCPWGT